MSKRTLNNFRIYVQARHEYQKRNFYSAINKLIKIPAQLQNQDVNHLLVKSLYHDHKYHLAENFMMLAINTYPDNWNLTCLMLKVFIKNHDFIKGREVIAVFNDGRLKQKACLMIKDAELLEQQTNQSKIRRLTSRFYHLADQSFIKQRIILAHAMKLPFNDFFKIAKLLLVDPFLHPLIRLSILDVLRKVGVDGQVNYRWLNGHLFKITINQLPDLTQMNSYRQIMRIVDQDYIANPINSLTLKQNLRLELSYLYPFNDIKVKLPHSWVKVAGLMIKGEQPPLKNERTKRIYALQLKLNRLTNRLKR